MIPEDGFWIGGTSQFAPADESEGDGVGIGQRTRVGEANLLPPRLQEERETLAQERFGIWG